MDCSGLEKLNQNGMSGTNKSPDLRCTFVNLGLKNSVLAVLLLRYVRLRLSRGITDG